MMKKISRKIVAVGVAAAAFTAVAATSANAHHHKKVRAVYASAATVLVLTAPVQQPSMQPWCESNYHGPFQCGGI